jgi:hypothetical protein
MLSSVDLPQPVGPTIATNSPSATVSSVRSTAVYVPPPASRKAIDTSLSATADAGVGFAMALSAIAVRPQFRRAS